MPCFQLFENLAERGDSNTVKLLKLPLNQWVAQNRLSHNKLCDLS